MSSQVLSTQASSRADQAAWLRFLRAHSALTRQLSARLESRHGLTLSDYDVLIQLYHAPERRMRRIDIARLVLLSPSGITRLLDGLERAGWVEKVRCDSDARVVYAALTAAGTQKCEEASETHLGDLEELFSSRFTPDEHEALAEMLGRLPLAETSEACKGEDA